MPVDLQAFGLNREPFEVRVLELLYAAADREMVCIVDGWSEVNEVKTYLQQRMAIGEAPFVFVAGDRGTGRRSMKNYILNQWASLCDVPVSNLVVCDGQIENFQSQDQFCDWVIRFRVAAQRHAQLAPATQQSFDTLMNRPPSLSAQIQRTMSYLLGDLQDDYAVAGVLHGANHRNILTYLKGSFEAISALVILVLENTTNVRQEIIKQIPTMLPEARVLELSALDQNQVRDVVKHRWEASAGSRDAIPDGGLVTAFSARRWSLAHVMEVMTQMLALKRIQMDSGQVPGIFTDQEISGYLKVLEQRGWKD